MILFRSYDGNPTDRPGFFPVVSPSRQERLAILGVWLNGKPHMSS